MKTKYHTRKTSVMGTVAATLIAASAGLTFGTGAATAGEAPEILGAADYRAMSQVEMASVTGENHLIGGSQSQTQSQTGSGENQQQQAQCLTLCAGGDVTIAGQPAPETP